MQQCYKNKMTKINAPDYCEWVCQMEKDVDVAVVFGAEQNKGQYNNYTPAVRRYLKNKDIKFVPVEFSYFGPIDFDECSNCKKCSCRVYMYGHEATIIPENFIEIFDGYEYGVGGDCNDHPISIKVSVAKIDMGANDNANFVALLEKYPELFRSEPLFNTIWPELCNFCTKEIVPFNENVRKLAYMFAHPYTTK